MPHLKFFAMMNLLLLFLQPHSLTCRAPYFEHTYFYSYLFSLGIFNLEQCSNLKNEQSEVLKLHLFFSSCLLPLFILQWQLTIVLLLQCLHCCILQLLNLKAKKNPLFILVTLFSHCQERSPEIHRKRKIKINPRIKFQEL